MQARNYRLQTRTRRQRQRPLAEIPQPGARSRETARSAPRPGRRDMMRRVATRRLIFRPGRPVSGCMIIDPGLSPPLMARRLACGATSRPSAAPRPSSLVKEHACGAARRFHWARRRDSQPGDGRTTSNQPVLLPNSLAEIKKNIHNVSQPTPRPSLRPLFRPPPCART